VSAAFWLNGDGDWLGPLTQAELADALVQAGYTRNLHIAPDGLTIVALGPDLGCLFVQSMCSLEGEHLYRVREVAA
jgi:hypothetical protein